MDKIWYINPSKSEVIGRCGGDDKKTRMTTQNRQKSNAKKYIYIFFLMMFIVCVIGVSIDRHSVICNSLTKQPIYLTKRPN